VATVWKGVRRCDSTLDSQHVERGWDNQHLSAAFGVGERVRTDTGADIRVRGLAIRGVFLLRLREAHEWRGIRRPRWETP